MIDRKKTIKGLEGLYYLSLLGGQITSGKTQAECSQHLENAIALLEDRTKDYESWARGSDAHTCATCIRASDNSDWHDCPIEQIYSLPKDGYCHLWKKVESDD